MTALAPRVIDSHLVLQHDPGPLRLLFPNLVKEARIKGETYCALPHSLDIVRVLNNVGVKAPSPIRTAYNWPGRYRPRWYQIDTAEFLTLHSRCYCLSAMRTGKTLAALWAADYLRQVGAIGSTLIVAPLSTLWDVWQTNIFESFPLRTFAVLYGSREKRRDLLAKKHDFYIINHHGLGIIEDDLGSRPDINHVVVDEVATFRTVPHGKKKRTTNSVLWGPLNRIVNKQKIYRSVWGLTGTPTPNAPTDAFGVCKIVTPENYNGHFTSFKHETMFQVKAFKWFPKKSAEQSVARILKPSIRFERSVCSTMEPCFVERRAELSPEQSKAYKQLLAKAAVTIKASVVTAVNAAVLIQKLVQIACGVVIDANGDFVKIDFGPRLKVLEELVEENNEKVLVFVPFTGALDAVASELRKRWSVEVVDGRVSAGKRTDIFQRFRSAKDPHVLVCHPQVMAHGLDLTAASLSIWYAPTWKAEVYQQANARMDGSKQKVKMDIACIYATAEEKRIYSVLRDKGRLQDVVLSLANTEV